MRVHRNCCGLDVHKKIIAACLIREDSEELAHPPHCQHMTFQNFSEKAGERRSDSRSCVKGSDRDGGGESGILLAVF